MQNTEPAEVALGRATVNLTALLDREMDAIFQDLLEELAAVSPRERQRAVAANRVVLLCRNLTDEIQRYEHLYWLHKHEPQDGQQEIEF
jgi:hypothetical protein